jgi:anthranilate phosphoribosyltransferase
MLNYKDIEDLVCMRMTDDLLRQRLLELTPQRIDSQTIGRFVQILKRLCAETLQQLPAIETATIDCCGTGGSGLPHFNTSTATAFVLASGGVKVAKFGNRAQSSLSGSFDFLKELGVPCEFPAASVPYLLDECGLAFLSAPQYYPVLSKLRAVRRSLKCTIFNFIGPLLNPVNPAFRLMGVSDPLMQRVTADYLSSTNNLRRALVVRGERGIDDIDCHGRSLLIEIADRRLQMQWFAAPAESSFPTISVPLSARQNLSIFRQITEGRDRQSDYYKLISLNAGAGFYTTGFANSIKEGIGQARELLASGAVHEQVERCRRIYAKYAA